MKPPSSNVSRRMSIQYSLLCPSPIESEAVSHFWMRNKILWQFFFSFEQNMDGENLDKDIYPREWKNANIVNLYRLFWVGRNVFLQIFRYFTCEMLWDNPGICGHGKKAKQTEGVVDAGEPN